MSYTIVGMFPTNEDADKASDKLDNAGFEKEDYNVSGYSTSGDYDHNNPDHQYDEDEKTSGFWNWLFGDNDHDKKKYSYAGSKSNLVTVYTDDVTRAEKARDVMNENGAINVNDFTKSRFTSDANTPQNDNLDPQERARIIAKAKNNLYFIEGDRFYTTARDEGMKSDMDSTGTSPNTF